MILDHLTPPMTQADSHGVMAELESQMDEYYEAAGMDRARSDALLADILATARRAGITRDCGIEDSEDEAEQLLKLDNYLCDLKELQIRDGLHVFGRSPAKDAADGLLAQILRTPRGDGEGASGSLPRALASDLGLGSREDFDPLTAERGLPWDGPRPDILARISDAPAGVAVATRSNDSICWHWRWCRGRSLHRGYGLPKSCRMRAIPSASVWMSAGRRRGGRDAAGAGRSLGSVRRLRRADARPAGSASDRAQFLFHRQSSAADSGGVAAWLGVGRSAA